MSDTPYIPDEKDLAWARGVVTAINEGGVYACPATGEAFFVSHTAKTLTRLGVPPMASDLSPDVRDWPAKLVVLFATIGYPIMERSAS